MYTHLLIAIDGSDLSSKALKQGLELAKALKAKATIIHVTAPWSTFAVGELTVMFPPQQYEANMAAATQKLLALASEEAHALGVECRTVHESDPQPYKAILATAESAGADLIVMGSHGRRGITGLLLGSEASKTLTHGNIPVLVYRE